MICEYLRHAYDVKKWWSLSHLVGHEFAMLEAPSFMCWLHCLCWYIMAMRVKLPTCSRTYWESFALQTLQHWPPFHLHCLMNSPGKEHWCRGTGVGTHHCKDFFWMFLQGFPSWLQLPEWMEIWVESFFSKKCVEVSPAFQHSSSHYRCQRRLIPTPLVLPADQGGISMSIRPCVSHVISPPVVCGSDLSAMFWTQLQIFRHVLSLCFTKGVLSWFVFLK